MLGREGQLLRSKTDFSTQREGVATVYLDQVINFEGSVCKEELVKISRSII
jgi:hypothetical protein